MRTIILKLLVITLVILFALPIAAEVIPGDANNDASVDIMDLVAIIDNIVSGAPFASQENADANKDGSIDIMDLVWVIDSIVVSDSIKPLPDNQDQSMNFSLDYKNVYFSVPNDSEVTITIFDTWSIFSLYSIDDEYICKWDSRSPITITLPANSYYLQCWNGEYDHYSASIQVKMKPGLNRDTFNLGVMGSTQLQLLGLESSVVWSSSNPTVASVSSTGLVRGIKKGTCQISCTLPSSTTYTCTVNVIDCATVIEVKVYTDEIYNDCYVKIRNNSDKTIAYYELKIEQFNGRGVKIKSPYDYYYSSDSVEPLKTDGGTYWVNDNALSCTARIIYVRFTDGTVWEP